MPPAHVGLQGKVHEYGLTDQYNSYKQELSNLGTVFDYDFASAITENRKNYLDPYHFDVKIAQTIVKDIAAYFKGVSPSHGALKIYGKNKKNLYSPVKSIKEI